jgi:hypothetical protein
MESLNEPIELFVMFMMLPPSETWRKDEFPAAASRDEGIN